ncbi:MAG: peroxiredoxin [Clostridia bacterium]|nr:peroxiredoxin [Clostridia bacterium]
MAELKKGMQAPEFRLNDKDGQERTLSEFAGRPVVLYFYPRDNTSGCTRQALAFAAMYGEFVKAGAEVIGVSKDSVSSHQKFAEKNALPFVLLSDPELKAIKDYGVWQEKKLYGKVSEGVVRSVFVIGPDGRLLDAVYKAKPDTGAEDALALVKALH